MKRDGQVTDKSKPGASCHLLGDIEMARELRGKIKHALWDHVQGVRHWFKDDCNSRNEPIDVASPDIIDEAHELGQSNEDAVDPAVEVIDEDLEEELEGPEYMDPEYTDEED
jgi:hypothetical protein